jgi:hypothetical protein
MAYHHLKRSQQITVYDPENSSNKAKGKKKRTAWQ